jgi:threonine dehydrogenase-like Zn-dependent dehydrogenase
VTVAEARAWLERLYIDAPGAALRKEDAKKAVELAALAGEIALALAHTRARGEITVVDAAAGKGYVGLLCAALCARAGRPAHVVLVERDEGRLASAQVAAQRLDAPGVRFAFRAGDVGDAALWPEAPSLAVALHACGAAADAVLGAAVAVRARRLVVVPCCTPAAERPAAETLGIPRHAPVRRAFLEALVAAERTLRLEAAGYATEVVAFVAPTVTPYNLAWRARRVGEPGRARAAAERLTRLV